MPGVYIFKSDKEIIYVGKAKNLKKRVASYFTKRASSKQRRIVQNANELEYMIFSNEREALIGEANLIYTYKPRFNVLLKDVRVYPYLNFVGDDFPYIEISHDKGTDSLGPYTSVRFLRELVDLIQPIVKLRSCKIELSKIKHPCFEYHIKRCSAPCIGLVSKKEYAERVALAKRFFNGEIDSVRKWIKKKINTYASKKMFEEAQSLKNVYDRMSDFLTRQSVEFPKDENVDAFEIGKGNALLMKIRNGMLLAKLEFEFDGMPTDFLKYYYFGKSQTAPSKVLVSHAFRGMKSWSKRLKTEIKVPKDAVERSIIELVEKNFEELLNSRKKRLSALKKLEERLSLKRTPIVIEGIDISHTSGMLTVASVVTFVEGLPKKGRYRKYNLANFSQPDDFEAMRQVIKRRYSKHPLPDLLLIDGGKGQVGAVIQALKTLNLDGADIVGIAKEDERLILTNGEEVHLPLNDQALRILVAVRDESHRFATSYHYLLREKKMTHSLLDEVKGIGPKRKKALLKRFKSVKGIKHASFEELKEVVGEKIAKEIKKFFTHRDSTS